MTADAGEKALAEALAWLEEQIVAIKSAQTTQALHAEQLQRQMHELADQAAQAQAEVRQIDPKLSPFPGQARFGQ